MPAHDILQTIIREERQAFLLRIRCWSWKTEIDKAKKNDEGGEKKSTKWWQQRCFTRAKLLACLMEILEGHTFPATRLSLKHPEFKKLGPTYRNIYKDWTLQTIIDDLKEYRQILYQHMVEMPDTTDPADPTRYPGYAILHVLPIVAIPVGHLVDMKHVDTGNPIVFARLDIAGNILFVNSNNNFVRRIDVWTYIPSEDLRALVEYRAKEMEVSAPSFRGPGFILTCIGNDSRGPHTCNNPCRVVSYCTRYSPCAGIPASPS